MRLLSRDGGRSRFTLSSTGWIVLAFSVSYLLAFQYYHSVSYRDPSSYFFNPRLAYEKRYSSRRIKEAETYINNAKDALPVKAYPSQPPFMCVGIATVARRGEQYVHLTVGSLLAGLSTQHRKEIFLDLLIGHTDPSKHPMISEPWVKTLPDRLLQYSPDSLDWDRIKGWEDGGWYRNKTIYDYTYLLRNCYDTGAKYIAIFEDDTLAMADWFPRTQEALRKVESAMKTRPKDERWIYLRLFYSDDLLGWNSEEWAMYLFWSVLVWVSFTGAVLGLKSCLGRKIDPLLTNKSLVTLSTTFVALCIILHFMAGRHTTQPIPPGVHEMNRYGCCSQGLVFPRTIVPDFLAQTDLTTDWLVDMMIEKISDQQQWTRWATVPPLLQHIGATSSKGYGFDDNAKKLWSFRFEEWPGQ